MKKQYEEKNGIVEEFKGRCWGVCLWIEMLRGEVRIIGRGMRGGIGCRRIGWGCLRVRLCFRLRI